MLIVHMPCRGNLNGVHALPGNANSVHPLSGNVNSIHALLGNVNSIHPLPENVDRLVWTCQRNLAKILVWENKVLGKLVLPD